MATTPRLARIGQVPTSPWRFSAREWLDVFKRSFRSFLDDDCMGLSQQVAFSSLLAFFPAVVFLVGLLDLVGAYEALKDFLAPVAPGDVIDTIETLQQETTKGTSAFAFVVGAVGATWAASGAMNAIIKAVNRAFDRVETRPLWKTRVIAVVLVVATGLVTAGLLLVIVFGGPLGEAIADQASLGGAFDVFWGVARWPLAFLVILLFFVARLLPRPERRRAGLEVAHTRIARRRARVARALGPVRALHELLRLVLEDLRALASGIVLLLWLNYSAFALLFGAELNAELDRKAAVRAAGGEDAGLVKPSRRR